MRGPSGRHRRDTVGLGLALATLLAVGVGCGRVGEAAPLEVRPGVVAGAYQVGQGPYAVRAIDLDASGTLDVVTANLVSENVSVLLTGPAARPVARYDLPTPGPVIAVATGDFDGDGVGDVVGAVRSLGGRLSPFFGRAARPPAPGPARWLFGTPNDVTAADLDGDGRDEVVVALRSDTIVVARMATDRSGFELERHAVPGCSGRGDYGPDGVMIEDLDGDGALDVVVACYHSWSLHVLAGRPGGGLVPAARVAIVPPDQLETIVAAVAPDELGEARSVSGGLRKVAATDLDGDGRLDLVAVGDYGVIALVVAHSSGFGSTRVLSTGVNGSNNLATADLDADGEPEVLLLSGMQPAILRMRAASLLTGRPVIQRLHDTPRTPESIVLIDLDRDDRLDLLAAGEHAAAVQLLRGDGAGGFQAFAH